MYEWKRRGLDMKVTWNCFLAFNYSKKTADYKAKILGIYTTFIACKETQHMTMKA